MDSRAVVGAALTLVALLGLADAYPSRLLAANRCDRDTGAGATIMGSAVVASAARSVVVDGLESGGTYTPGATVSVSLGGSGGQGLLEVVGGGSFSSGTRGCSNTRTSTLTGVNLVLPTSGAVTIRGLWASRYGTVNLAEFTLTGAVDPCAGVTCDPASSACKVQGTCSADTGQCSPEVNANDGTDCDDGDAATINDVCTAGVCAGSPPPPPPARSCADTDADGVADNFDCSGSANGLHSAPSSVTCAADPCTATECCTVVPGPPQSDAKDAAPVSSGGEFAAVATVLHVGALLMLVS